MEKYHTQQVMEEIQKRILENTPQFNELNFTTFYYRKLIKLLKEFDQLILFGAGRYGEIVRATLQLESMKSVQCFCDNNSGTWGKIICGLEVLSPQDAFSRYPDACFVITPKDYENEILRQLVHMGVTIDHILIFNIKNTGMAIEI